VKRSEAVFTVHTPDGWSLEIEEFPPADESTPIGTAVLTHAMMVDRRTYIRGGHGFAPFLAERGWRVFAADFRGRNRFGPVPAQGAQWSYDDLVSFDVPTIVASVRARVDDAPLVYVGHSLGGHTGLAAAGADLFDRPPDAYVCLSANIWRPSLEPNAYRRLKKSAQFWLFAQAARHIGYIPARAVRMGPCDEASTYALDLYRAWETDRWSSRDGRLDYTRLLAHIRPPVLSVVGQGDRLMAHPVGARAWFSDVGSQHADFWIAKKGDFGLSFDPDHMNVVTATASRPLWGAIENWMHRALQGQ